MFHYRGHSKDGGIYVIFNVSKWRLYVGSCAGFQKRWWQHLQALRKQKHANKFLQADFNQCGETAFEFHVLEVMPNTSREERLEQEQYWLDIHFDNGKLCYNLRKEAVSREGKPDRDPEITRQKRSESAKKAGIKPPSNRGKAHSHETKEKIRKALLGRRKGPHTDEHKQKISESAKGNTNGCGYRHSAEAKRKIGEAIRQRKLHARVSARDA